MKGYTLKYKVFDSSSRINLHHILFGRIIYRNSHGKKYAYYIQGMLNKTPFIRIMNSVIFVLNLENINLEELRIFADITVKETEREINIESMKTGEQYWRDISIEKELPFHIKKRNVKY